MHFVVCQCRYSNLLGHAGIRVCHYSDKTLETIAANIAKLMHIDKTSFETSSPPVQCCEHTDEFGELNFTMEFIINECINEFCMEGKVVSTIVLNHFQDNSCIMQRRHHAEKIFSNILSGHGISCYPFP
jgi:hypothetical protein